MNDIDLLRTHGPEGPDLSDRAAHAARARLTAEITAPPPARRSWFPLPRTAVAGLALAAVAAVGVTVMPELVGGDSATVQSGPIRLVAATAPEFPYTLPDVGKPSFTADPGGPIKAVHGDLAAGDTVVLYRLAKKPLGWNNFDVDDHDGRLTRTGSGSARTLELDWERRAGEWVRLIAHGRFATDTEVLRLARSVTDEPQPVGFKVTLGLAPDGWQLGGFKGDATIAILTYQDRAAGREVSVVWSATPPEDSGWEGFEAESKVRVLNRPARLIRTTDRWILVGTFAGGGAYQLMTPRDFTEAQILETATSMTVH